jgi:PAS domain S-box-containing protein
MRRGSGPKKSPSKAKGKPRSAAAKVRPRATPASRHLEERLAEALAQQAATGEILRVISSSPADAQPVFDAIVRNAAQLCGADFSAVVRFEAGLLHLVALNNLSPEEADAFRGLYPRPPERGFALGRAFLDGRAAHVEDVLADHDYDRGAQGPLVRATGYRTFLAVPILRGGVPIGAIGCARREAKPFSAAQIDLVRTFAEQAVIAIGNVELFGELERRNLALTETLEQQTATGEILRAISSSPTDIRPVLETVVHAAARFCGAPDVAILRVDRNVLRGAAAVGPFGRELASGVGGIEALELPLTSGSVSGRAVVERRSIHVHDLLAEPEDELPIGRDLQRRFGHHTILATPLLREGTPLGAIVLFRTEVKPFSDRQLDLVRIFADQAVIAIENVRLFQELGARNAALSEALEQQTATSEMLKVISRSTVELQPVLETVVESATRLCGATRGHIFRFDGDVLRFAVAYGAWPGFQEYLERNPTRPGPGSVAGRAAAERRAIHVDDVLAVPDYEYGPLVNEQDYRTVLAVPMLREDVLLGVIVILKARVEPFSEKQIELVTTFADQAVIAIENVRLLSELQARNRDLTETLEQQTATGEILRVISSSPTDVQPVFETIVKNARALCGSDSAGVFMYDGAMVRIEALDNANPAQASALRDAYPSPATAGSATGRALLSGRPAHIPDVREDPTYVLAALRDTVGIRTLLSVPMVRDGVAIGAITVQRWGTPRAFSDAQIALLETFADQAVIAIQNVRLFRELEARNHDLTETLEQQTATGEILRVISSSPTDVQPVFDAVVKSAARLCESFDSSMCRRDGDRLVLVAHHGPIPIGPVGEFSLPLSRGNAWGRAVLDAATVHVPDMQDETAEFPESSANAQRMGFRTILCVPLLRDGAALGTIQLRRTSNHRFTERQVVLLQTFADQAVIAIENVRLFKELEVRNRALTETLEQQTATGEILRVISSSPTDVQPVFDTIVRSVVRLCDGLFSALFRFDGELIHQVAQHNFTAEGLEEVRRIYPVRPTRDHGSGRTILERAVVHIPDVEQDPEYRHRGLTRAVGMRSGLYVPMMREGRPIGVIMVARAQSGPFSDAQIGLLQTFADQAVIAIENVRLFKELEVRNRDLTETLEQQTATGEILRVISSSPTDIQPVFDIIAKSAVRLCGAEVSVVTRWDGDLIHVGAIFGSDAEGVAALRRTFPMRPGPAGGAARVIHERAIVHIPDVVADPSYRIQEAAVAAGFRALLGVPMLRDGRAIGAITIGRAEPGTFSDPQVQLLSTFAEQATIAIENVRLFKELEVRNRDLTETLEQQTATGEILRVISSTPTDVQPVFDAVVTNAVRLCGALHSAAVRLEGGLLHLVSHHNWSPEGLATAHRLFPMPLTRDHVTAHAVREARTIHLHRMQDDPTVAASSRELAIAQGYQTLLVVPMLRESQAIGAIIVAKVEGPFSESQVALLQTFADQAVIAIENVRLFTELEARNSDLTETLEQQTATGEILRVISSSPTDAQPVFDTIAESARRLCEAEFCQVFRYEAGALHFVASEGHNREGLEAAQRAFPRPADRGTTAGRAILDAGVAQIQDVHSDPEYAVTAVADAMNFRSLVAVPMMREGRPVGAISVARAEPGVFPDRQVELLRTFADQAVIAIENVRLFTELGARNRDLTNALEQQIATADVLSVMSASATDTQPVFDAIVRNAVRLCHARFALVYQLAGDVIRFVTHHNLPPAAIDQFQRTFPQRLSESGTLVARAILRGEVINVADIAAESNVSDSVRELALSSGYRSVLAVPIMREGRALGALAITRSSPAGEPQPFSSEEIPLLQTFTEQAGIAIENVRLFKELEARTSQLTRSVGELQALGEVSQAVSSTLDLDAVLETIVGRAVQLSGSDQGVAYEFDEATRTFHQRATHRMTPEYVETMRVAPIRLGEGAIGRAGVTRASVQVADIQHDAELVAPQARRRLLEQGMGSLLAVPLIREDRLLGGLVIIRRERGAFPPEAVAMLQTFATQSVLAIHNARLFQEIQRQKQYADTLLETSPVAIVTMDLNGSVVGWNPGAERLFGYPPVEALGRAMEDLIATPELREEVRANIRNTLAGEWIRSIARRTRKDGTIVDVEISSLPVIVAGAKVGMIGIYHDITELLRARREAETANEAKGAFLATMSHEIRTPMNAVIGMSGLLLNTRLTEEQRDYAEVIRGSGDTLLTVINDILDFSKIEAGKLELEAQPFDLRECVEGALDLVATRAAEKGIDLAYLMGDGVPTAIVGDVTRLRQVLLNLLSNAVKFTERGEVVLSVSARRTGRGKRRHELTFTVRDTGIGIPADRLGRLFQSFSQVDASTTRRYGGTGLGLAISQRLTELMGGQIGVASEVGTGSEFHFSIPAVATEVPVPLRRDLSGVQPSLRDKRVLVVDDNATNRRIVTAHLDNWGMPSRASESPVEALAWIRAGERFDVAILDMHMPEMDGVALAHAIRQLPAGTTLPLILFTSLGRREAHAEDEGFAAYLHKPIKPSQLFDALVSVVADQPVHVAARAARSELDPEMARRHPLRILLAEDNVVNQKVALRLLAQMGYRADVAANGLEAIEAVERQTYDVVLMDVQMPELDGFEASREINRRWPAARPRIVAMTANAMQGDRELCVAAGMDDYVAKPIRVEELVAALDRSPAHREAAPAAGPAEPAAPAASAIDRAVFERLVATTGGPFVAELIDTFGEDARELLATLRRALAATDRDAFRRAAHSLKSTAESLGATGLAALARELEATARAGSLDGAAGRLDRLTEHYERAASALGDLRRDLTA